jgi:glycine cleavage system regulatory protein
VYDKTQAPFGGTTLFMMEGLIAMPVKLSTSELIHNLDTLQTTLGVDITISSIPIPAHHKFHTASTAQSVV